LLSRRLASAAVLIVGMILLIRVDFWLGTPEMWGRPGIGLAILSAIAAALCGIEFSRMWQGQNRQSSIMMASSAVIMSLIASAPVLWRDYPVDCPIGKFGWPIAGIFAAMLLSFAAEFKSFQGHSKVPGEIAGRIGRTVLMVSYLAMLFGFVVPLRLLEQSNSLGLISIICLIATVKTSDAAAYFAGKSFGTVKLAPQISPGKTIQGTLAAPLGGYFAAAIVIYIVSPVIFDVTIDKPWWWVILFSVLVTFAGVLGDLAESLLKRDAQCKEPTTKRKYTYEQCT